MQTWIRHYGRDPILPRSKSKDAKVLDWLLEKDQPAVRYRTLIDLLDYSEEDAEVRETRSKIPTLGWAQQILASQEPEGYWESGADLYYPKYTATIWRLIVLADLGLTAKEPRIRKPSKFFLNEYARPDSGFDMPGSTRSELCIVGNLARTLYKYGYGDDARVRSAYEWLVSHQMEDGGWHCFPERAFGRGTLDCWEGLGAYAAVPRSKWTKGIKRSVERGVEFYLHKELFKEGRRRYLPWLRFHYPVHYYYDILLGLDVITSLGYADDKRLRPALELLEEKRRPDGTWSIDRTHPDVGRGAGYRLKGTVKPFELEKAGEPSKWITLSALRVLRRTESAS